MLGNRKVNTNILCGEKIMDRWREKSEWRICVFKVLRTLQIF